jgi:hypothetical protein
VETPLNVKTFWHTSQTIYIFNVTQQNTQKKAPDDDVHTSKHVGAVECINKLSEQCICWLIVQGDRREPDVF